jgi:hypothetical protein
MLDLHANLALDFIWSEVSREFGLTVNIGALFEAFTRCEDSAT